MKKLLKNTPSNLAIAGIFLYFLSITWVNFHSALWNQMDIYSYTLEGKLMYDAKSFFPEGWLFGNQYQILASPNLAALFYGMTHDSNQAMAIASTVSSALILLAFWWCFRPFISRKGMTAGLLCIIGGIIFGTSASTYISGLQVLHTMASFYACYLVVLLITLGCYFRLKQKESTPWIWIVLSLPLNFAMGMQSPRELLILSIPLVVIEGLEFLVRIARKKSFGQAFVHNAPLLFVLGIFLFELAGHFYMQSLHIPATPIIGGLALDLSPSGLASNMWASAKNVLRISGIAIVADGLRFIPLSICALVVSIAVIWSILHIIATKDQGVLSQAIIFSVISLAGVFFVGVFLMRTRDIYYFVYWFLAALSVAYCVHVFHEKYAVPVLCALLLVSAVNYAYSFIPNYKDYGRNHSVVADFTEKMVSDGITTIYVDASPIFAASSKDQIISQSYWLDVDLRCGYPLYYFPSDKYVPAYDDEHYRNSLICMSSHYLGEIPKQPESFQDALLPYLEYYDEITVNQKRFVFYRPLKRLISPTQAN